MLLNEFVAIPFKVRAKMNVVHCYWGSAFEATPSLGSLGGSPIHQGAKHILKTP